MRWSVFSVYRYTYGKYSIPRWRLGCDGVFNIIIIICSYLMFKFIVLVIWRNHNLWTIRLTNTRLIYLESVLYADWLWNTRAIFALSIIDDAGERRLAWRITRLGSSIWKMEFISYNKVRNGVLYTKGVNGLFKTESGFYHSRTKNQLSYWCRLYFLVTRGHIFEFFVVWGTTEADLIICWRNNYAFVQTLKEDKI